MPNIGKAKGLLFFLYYPVINARPVKPGIMLNVRTMIILAHVGMGPLQNIYTYRKKTSFQFPIMLN